MTRRMLLLAALAALICSENAAAQFYKGKTVTMIINYPAGGPTDIEGRIIARHLASHIPGKPTIIVKNVGGAGGLIGSNFLGEIARPDGDTFGFFTWNPLAQLLGDPGLRVNYSDFMLIAGVENPVVVYMRKDTPPGIQVAADIMKARDFKALSLDVHNTNTIHQALSLDLLGLKFKPVAGYRGLKEVETAILQKEGQLANSSLPGWRASIEPNMAKQGIVLPLWQIAPPQGRHLSAQRGRAGIADLRGVLRIRSTAGSRPGCPTRPCAWSRTRRPRCSAPSSCRRRRRRKPWTRCAAH